MSLVSAYFLIFLLAVIGLYYIVPKSKQWVVLLVASYTFYLFAGIKPLFFILTTTITTYFGALALNRIDNSTDAEGKKLKGKVIKAKKRKIFAAVLIFNFLILCFLKYYNFAAESINGLFGIFAYDSNVPLINIILPLGISFYTFQAMGYLIDVFRKKYEPERNFWRFALFISFFPQIVQGPISRFDSLGFQLREPHYFDYRNFTYGAQLILWGFVKKMIIADRASALVNPVFNDYSNADGTLTAFVIVIYAIQIYADFSGGIDITRGAAQMMGIDLIENFRRPYFADSVADYWRRWHISLTGWMRDYVFYTMALSKWANRVGKWSRKHIKGSIGKQFPYYFPTFIVFILTGIWHGAGWGFVVFGIYNAGIITLSMILESAYTAGYNKFHINPESTPWKLYRIIRTFLIICIGKCFTRATSVGDALAMLKNSLHCFDLYNIVHLPNTIVNLGFDGDDLKVLLLGIMLMFIVDVVQERGIVIRDKIAAMPLPARWLLFLLGLGAVLVLGSYGPGYSATEFIYRNF